MRSTHLASPLRTLASVAACIGVAVPAASSSAFAATATDIATASAGADRLRPMAENALGLKRFACVGPTTVQGGAVVDLVLLSTDRKTRELARRVARKAGVASFTRLRSTSPKRGRGALLRITSYLQRTSPEPGLVSYGFLDENDPRTCGRLVLTVAPPAAESTRSWALAAQRHFGSYRLQVHFPPAGSAITTG